MGSMRARLLSGLLAVVLLIAGTAHTLAAGNPLLQARLFAAYPEARIVHMATLEAQRTGTLRAPVFSKGSGRHQREWSLDNARKAVTAFATHMREAAGSRGIEATVTVLLVSDVYLARIATSGHEVELSPFTMGETREYIDIYTTTIALRALVDGRLDWRKALDSRLLILGEDVPGRRKVHGTGDGFPARGSPPTL